MAKKFKVGDDIRILADHDDVAIAGRFGKVVQVNGDDWVTVRIDDWHHGWDLDDYSKDGDCWGMPTDKLEKLPKKKKKRGKQAYLGNGKHDWELVVAGDEPDADRVERLRVPGGWLYRDHVTVTTTFVRVPDVTGHVI